MAAAPYKPDHCGAAQIRFFLLSVAMPILRCGRLFWLPLYFGSTSASLRLGGFFPFFCIAVSQANLVLFTMWLGLFSAEPLA